MSLFTDKAKEVLMSVLPISIIVLILNFTLVPIENDLLFRFILGAILIFIGLTIFLVGVDLGIQRIGELFGEVVAKSSNYWQVAVIGFLLGFLITVAEPDLLILGDQIEAATGGIVTQTLTVNIVSIGVGFMVALGLFRILLDKSYLNTMTGIYLIILLLSIFMSEEFLAIAFDSSGATTGAMTTPFVLALGLGVAQLKQGKNVESDSFGMVGMMSAGPIIAIALLSIFGGFTDIQGGDTSFQSLDGYLQPFLDSFPSYMMESLIAILPITLLFFAFNALKIKANKNDIRRIIVGTIYTLIGLSIFLTGVNTGFMEMGRVIGSGLASMANSKVLPLVGFIIGMVVVLAEPAVYVLGNQVEDVTGGHIKRAWILITLSIGVGFAVCLSMLRIMIAEFKLWHILLPGFVLALIIARKVQPIFVGIAFDAGGVASGPMTATFVLALAQGAAEMIPTANVLVDGFGVISAVAMTPVFSIMILGYVYEIMSKRRGLNAEA